MTADEPFTVQPPVAQHRRLILVPVLLSIALHGLLAIATLTVSLTPSTPSLQPKEVSDRLSVRIVTAAPAPMESPAVPATSTAQEESITPAVPDSAPSEALAPPDSIVVQPLPTPRISTEDAGETERMGVPDILSIRESVRGLADVESRLRALEDCNEHQRRNELFHCEPERQVSEVFLRGSILPNGFILGPAPLQVEDEQDLPFTERNRSARALDQLNSGDRTYELMKRVMGRQ